MAKNLLKYILFGIVWGWMFLVLTYLIFDLLGMTAVTAQLNETFRWQALGSALVGMGFATPSIVYLSDRLRLWQQLLIHISIGMPVYLAVALWLGWMPRQSVGAVVAFVLLALVFFFLIWSGFFLYNRREARKMNERLRQMEQDED